MTMGCEWAGIGPVPNVVEVLEIDSASFAANELVTLSGGYATIAADDGIFGVAMKASTNVTTGNITIPIQVIEPGQVWIMQSNTTTAVTQVGEDYGLTWTTGSQAVDIADTTTPQVRIEKLDPRDGATTGAGGRVHVKFCSDVLIGRIGG
jgi:hypothetical protein